jgi:hypothetical protein
VSAQQLIGVQTCRNDHPSVNADGSSNVYTYPPREGRKRKITCRVCRDGLPRERTTGPTAEPTVWDKFGLKRVRSRKDEREDYAFLRRFGLIEAWAKGLEIDDDDITEDFFVALNRRSSFRLRRAYRLISEFAQAEIERINKRKQAEREMGSI